MLNKLRKWVSRTVHFILDSSLSLLAYPLNEESVSLSRRCSYYGTLKLSATITRCYQDVTAIRIVFACRIFSF